LVASLSFPLSLHAALPICIISMIIVGFIVGLLARAIMPGDQKMGWILTTILGIVGAFVAGYLGQALGWYQPGEGAGWIGSIVGRSEEHTSELQSRENVVCR